MVKNIRNPVIFNPPGKDSVIGAIKIKYKTIAVVIINAIAKNQFKLKNIPIRDILIHLLPFLLYLYQIETPKIITPIKINTNPTQLNSLLTN